MKQILIIGVFLAALLFGCNSDGDSDDNSTHVETADYAVSESGCLEEAIGYDWMFETERPSEDGPVIYHDYMWYDAVYKGERREVVVVSFSKPADEEGDCYTLAYEYAEPAIVETE